MTRNPIINALIALIYIILVVITMTFITQPLKDKPDTFFAPITFLLVLTLSVAVMAYLFFYKPLLLFIDGQKKAAVDLFIKTVAVFGTITGIILILLSTGLI